MKKRKKSILSGKINILNTFIFTLLVSILVFGLVVIITVWGRYQRDMRDNAITMSDQAVSQCSNSVEKYVNELREMMLTIARKQMDGEEIEDVHTLFRTRKDIADVAVYDNSGNILNCYTSGANVKEKIIKNLSFPETIQKEGIVQISQPHVVTIFNNSYPWVVSFSVTVKSDDDKKLVVVMDVLFSEIVELLENVSIGEHGYCYIVDDDKKLIYHPKQQLVNNNIQSFTSYSQDGVYVENDAIYTVKSLGNSSWNVVGICYVDEMIYEKVDTAMKSLLVIMIVVLVGAMLLGYAFGGLYAEEIRGLIREMERFEQQTEKYKYEQVNGTKEITMLSQSFNHLVDRIQALMKKVRNEEITLRKTELKALQAQINPHFLYNTLDAITWMCEQGENEEAGAMVASLARLFRISISKGAELIPIEKEILHAESYLKIEEMRYKNQFTYSFDVDERCLHYFCNKITLQPIIENAIYHGVNQMLDEGEINIRIYEKNDDIVFEVEDNGIGMSKERCEEILCSDKSENTGIGVANVNERIKIYFGECYGVSIDSEIDVGTKVTITLPKIERGEHYEKNN